MKFLKQPTTKQATFKGYCVSFIISTSHAEFPMMYEILCSLFYCKSYLSYFRRCLLEFCNNVESRHLFICFTGENSKGLVASFRAVAVLKSKALFFIKSQSAGKVTRDNINEDVFYSSCSDNVVKHFEILTREIFLPLLSIEQAGGVSADKLMDILHRLISSLQIIEGNIEVPFFDCCIKNIHVFTLFGT